MGGAIYSLGELDISNSLFRSNTTEETDPDYLIGGGAIYCHAACTITCSIFSKNQSASSGGAIFLADTTGITPLSITNTLFYENRTSELGGAILSWSDLDLINCTIANNIAEGDIGAVYVCGSNLTLKNSIVVFNSGFEIGGQGHYFLTAFHLLISTDAISWTDQSTAISVCPKNTALFENMSEGNYRLIQTDWTIDKGDNSYVEGLSTDLAGSARISDGIVDLGAYEVNRIPYDYQIPIIFVDQYKFLDGQILKLVIQLYSNNPYPVDSWTLSWGDIEDPQSLSYRSNRIKVAHYFATEDIYDLTLTIKTGKYETTYDLGSYSFGDQPEVGESAIPLPKESDSISKIEQADPEVRLVNGYEPSVKKEPVLSIDLRADSWLFISDRKGTAERHDLFRTGNWDTMNDSDEFEPSFFKLLLESGNNTAMHLTDAAFAQIESHSDLFHGHFFVVVEDDDESFVSRKTFGNKTHEIGFLNPFGRILTPLIFDQIDFGDIF